MNFRNLFSRSHHDEITDSTPREVNPAADNSTSIVSSQNEDPCSGNEEIVGPDRLTVPDATQETLPESNQTHSAAPWIVRDAETFEREKGLMNDNWPDFQLEVIDDSQSPLHGATCWSGTIKPGFHGDMEWELLVIYLGVGDGHSDWSGAISVYFLNPTDNQIIETLGYVPPCMLRDSDGTYLLGNLRPLMTNDLSASAAVDFAFEFCSIIERMCEGELPEDILREVDFRNAASRNEPRRFID